MRLASALSLVVVVGLSPAVSPHALAQQEIAKIAGDSIDKEGTPGSAHGSKRKEHVVVLTDKKSRPYIEATRGITDIASSFEVVPLAKASARLARPSEPGEIFIALGPRTTSLLFVSMNLERSKRGVSALVRRGDVPPGMRAIGVAVPPPLQLPWIRHAFPGRNRLLILRRRGALDEEGIRKAAAQSKIMFVDVDSPGTAVFALKRALQTGRDRTVVWLLPDPAVITANTIAPIAQAALSARVPVVGFSPYFLRVGALAAVETDYRKMGQAALAFARENFVPDNSATIEMVRAPSGRLRVNKKLAGRLGIVVRSGRGVAYGTLARSEPLVAPTLEAFLQDKTVMRVEILDDTGAHFVTKEGPAKVGPELVVTTPIMTREMAPGDVDDELGAFGIVPTKAQRVGKVVATFSRAQAREVEQRLTREFIIVFLTLGGLGLIIVLFIASGVVRRVQALARGAAAVKNGDEGVVVDTGGGDELSMLSEDFNAMARSLEAQRTQLDDAAGELAAKESLAAIGRATAVIAHELKNPLGIVLGASRILESERKSVASKEKAARIISEEVRRLDTTLKGLLDFARPQKAVEGDVDVFACAQDVARRATLSGGPAEGASVAVRGADDVIGIADEQQLSQALWNLVQNAVQAGASDIVIDVSHTQDADAGDNRGSKERVQIRIHDDGSGIADEVVPTLFVPFVTSKQRGAGLGLSGARRMMRNVGGDLRLQSPRGHHGGAVFVIELLLGQQTPGEQDES